MALHRNGRSAERSGHCATPAQPRQDGMRVLRWLLALLILGLAWLALALPALGFVVSFYPEPRFTPPSLTLTETDDGLHRHVGANERRWIGPANDGMWYLALAGDAVTRGWAHGLLLGDRAHVMEREMMQTMTTLVPGWPSRHLLLGVVGLNNRTLPRYFTDDELLEIAAEVASATQRWGAVQPNQPHYPRVVQYHALHDISHTLIDHPLVRVPQIGCTAVAVNGRRTVDGGLIVGRLFDFEGGEAFDRDKVVQLIRPSDGIAYLSVAWPGGAGAVTGMNEAGLWVSLNAADTAGGGTVGRPVIMAAREILSHCRTLAEAEAVLRRTAVFVSETILVASADEDRAVAFELGPRQLALRPMQDDALVVTNHFLAPEWAEDPVNARRLRDGTSPIRYARAQQCLDRLDQVGPAELLDLLRDRKGVDDVDVGFGNRGTINAWIGAHLAVADLRRRTIWVCGPWHGLGTARAFTFDGPAADWDLPASPEAALHDQAALRWDRLLRTAETLLAAGRRAEAAQVAHEAAALNPRHWHSLIVLAEISDVAEERQRLATAALAARPPYPGDRARVLRVLGTAEP